MDSLTQFALGAAVGEAVLGRKMGRKALLWGGACGTIPDLDVFIPLGDAVKDFTYHRSFSHSVFVLAILTPIMAWLIQRMHPSLQVTKKHLAIMVYLVFVTHVLLDCFTAYGTQIFWPIDNTPVAWSTIFIIDPLYTLPLIVGIIAALIAGRQRQWGYKFNAIGLSISTLYLAWTVGAKLNVDDAIEQSLQQQQISYEKIFTTPTPFNSLLWRGVVMDNTGYYEVYFSLLDPPQPLKFTHYMSSLDLLGPIQDSWPVQRLQWFSKGFYRVSKQENDIVMSDLRMGLNPNYVFSFKVGEVGNPHTRAVKPQQLENEWEKSMLQRVWQRISDPLIIINP